MKSFISFIVILTMLFSSVSMVQAEPTPTVNVIGASTTSTKPAEIYADTDGTLYQTDSEYFDTTYITKKIADGGYELIGKDMTETYAFILKNNIFYFAGLNFDGFFVMQSMNKDGSGKKKLSDESLTAFTVSPAKIYISSTKNHGIYEMNLDGSGLKKISEDVAYTLVYHDDKLYYNASQLQMDEPAYMKAVFPGPLKVLDLKTYQPSLLVNGKVVEFDVYNGYIYYNNSDEDFTLYRIKAGGTTPEKLNIKAFDFAFKDNSIYYSDAGRLVPWSVTFESKLPSLSKANLDGTDVIQLTNYPASDVSISGDFIRYHEYCDGGFMSYDRRHTIDIKTLPDIRKFE